ncbi:MAG: NifU family protein [Propionibacteriaceae bacterium]
MPPLPEPVEGPDSVGGSTDQLRATGERIATLLEASGAGGAVARERAEELVRLVADLYGAGLERLLTILYDRGALDDDSVDALAADDLVASLLLVHDLHPYDVTTRVQRALDGVRPYLGSHGGDVELLGVGEDGVVRLRLLGSCDGCASSSVTLTLAVEGAIEAAAPEVVGIEVETPSSEPSGPLVPVDSLWSRVGDHAGDHAHAEDARGSTWQHVPELTLLADGAVTGCLVAGTAVVGCRIGTDLFAFRDRCAGCDSSLAGGALGRVLGDHDVALRCPGCGSHWSVRRAGAGLDRPELHLHPLPLLVTNGEVTVAVGAPAVVPA